MTKTPRPTLARSVEMFGALAVTAGFAQVVYFFFTRGYLPPPFVFDTADTFMDWFHTAYWAHNEGAYTVWRTIYLPLSFVVTRLFSNPWCYDNNAFNGRECDSYSIFVLVVGFLAAIIVSAIAFRRNDRSTWFPRSIAVALGGPLLFTLERGNVILFAYIAFVLLYGGLIRTRAGTALAAGFLVNMKVYLLLPLAAYAIKRDWRTFELAGLAALAIYLVSLTLVGAGTPFELIGNLQNWLNSFAISIWDQLVYSTTYQPYLLFDVLEYPIRDFVDPATVDLAKSIIYYEVQASRTIALLCIVVAWFYPRAVTLQRLVFFILMQSFMGQNPGGYSITLIVFLIFLEKKRNFATMLAVACAYLVSIPSDFTIAVIFDINRLSWLSGQMVQVDYSLTIGTLIRPLVFAIMLWIMAIDTLIAVHRAVRAGPPTLGLSGRRWGEDAEPRPAAPQPA